jgi:PAS domain S-box-containing protein
MATCAQTDLFCERPETLTRTPLIAKRKAGTMKAAIERTLIAGITLVIGGVVVIDLASIREAQRLQDTSGSVRHSNQVIYQTQQVLVASIDYEAETKDFLLTGDSSVHDPMWRSAVRLHRSITDLRKFMLDNPVQEARMDSLLQYTNRNMALLDSVVRIRQSYGLDAAAAAVAADTEEKAVSDRIRSLVEALHSEENRLLDERREVNRKTAYGLQGALTALIVAVAILLLVIIRVDLSRAKKAREQLRLFNEELEEQVRLKTADLRASEEKYKTLFYKSPLPKWIYDCDTLEFIEVNEAAIANYGYSQEEFRKMKIDDIRPPEDVNLLMEELKYIRNDHPEESRHGYWRHVKKNGEIIFVEVTAHPLEYDRRNARMVVAADITARRQGELLMEQLNEDLRKRAGELAASNAELERFAYVASHDLQEPLRMVSSFLQLLQKKYGDRLDDKADQYIHYAVDGAERMKTLIMDLLEYSRVGSGKENFTLVNMHGVVDEVSAMFRDKIMAAGALVATTGPLPVIRAEKGQMVQLFQNLVGNALKYRGRQPPMIRIGVREEPDNWQFAVCDNGIGIEPAFWDKIFLIFQRLHNKSEYSGTGIGLAICKKIVERHGGNIRVESVAGEGSTFFFTISKHI